jgi:hypothetical protein
MVRPPAGNGRNHGSLARSAESTTVEIDLVEHDGATTLRLVHHVAPQQGWIYFLGILRDILSMG